MHFLSGIFIDKELLAFSARDFGRDYFNTFSQDRTLEVVTP